MGLTICTVCDGKGSAISVAWRIQLVSSLDTGLKIQTDTPKL